MPYKDVEKRREASRKSTKKYLEKNPDYLKKYYQDNKERWQETALSQYGITVEQYKDMLEEQSGVCAVCSNTCSSKKSLAVDHNHETGRVRGLLCLRCNTALGLLKDDPATIENLLRYANRHIE